MRWLVEQPDEFELESVSDPGAQRAIEFCYDLYEGRDLRAYPEDQRTGGEVAAAAAAGAAAAVATRSTVLENALIAAGGASEPACDPEGAGELDVAALGAAALAATTASPAGGSWLTAAVPMENPYCGCELTHVLALWKGPTRCSRTTRRRSR